MKRDHFGQRQLVWTVLIFGAMWFLLFRVLALHWSATRQYGYGWLVPFLALYLGLARWKTRPPPGVHSPSGWWIAVAGAFLLFPTWMVLQPNPDWRLLSWIMTAAVVAVTLGTMAAAGGISWARHFAFPCLFVFTAAPWPRPLEIPLIESLTRGVTLVSVEALNLIGTRAVQDGNLIETSGGRLGVEEACSGIQSVQAALMVSLFFGEFLRLGNANRLLLVVAGISVAFVTNVARTCFLAFHGARSGTSAVAAWHDPAANVALLLCLVAVWLLAVRLSDRAAPQSLGSPSGLPDPPPLSRRVLGALTVWLLVILAATEAWYRNDGTSRENRWALAPPPESTPMPLSAAELEQLQADEIVSGSWRDMEGRGWQLYFFRWKPGPPRSRLLARLHRPEVCLPAIGFRMVEDRGQVIAGPPELPLEFRALSFEANGHPLFVYTGTWENRTPRAEKRERLSSSLLEAAFQSVSWRERNLGQQVAEVAISGCRNAAEADAVFQRAIPALLERAESADGGDD